MLPPLSLSRAILQTAVFADSLLSYKRELISLCMLKVSSSHSPPKLINSYCISDNRQRSVHDLACVLNFRHKPRISQKIRL